MKLVKILGLVSIFGAIIVLVILLIVGYFRPTKAGLLIQTNPNASVFINDQPVGRTKYEETLSAGEISLKLVPESFDKPLVPYEVKLTLAGGVKTIVQHDFGASDETSSGVIVSYEKTARRETAIAVVSAPDGAQIILDGQVRNITPFKTGSVSVGEHTLSVAAQGYTPKSIKIKAKEGYKLTAVFSLGRVASPDPSPTPLVSPSPTPAAQYLIEILNTPTGFLRVRSEPSPTAPEVGQVEPGKKYKLVEEDEKTGWFKIEEGWISNQYAKKVLSGDAAVKN